MEMKVDSDPFEVNSKFVEPCCFEAHMVGFHSFEFDTSLRNFEQNIRQQLLFSKKERMKKELAHKEEQVRQRHGPRRAYASSSMTAQTNSNNPTAMSWMQVHGNQDKDFREYNEYQNRCNFRGRGGRGRGRFNGRFGQNRGRGHFRFHGILPRNPPSKDSSEILEKGVKTSALDRVVFPSQEKGKYVVTEKVSSTEPMLKDQDDDLYDDEFVEEDEMISVVSILPAEYANSSQECQDGDY
ncbi:hypothetical protein PIB30_046633 [Stylosanthes scabra]|uniref:Uncharacterized protein n=1 Tax=Stylosanthes scabra TaxID=79078 RepID=A0ABU6VJE4_9FABA|nr:hypothetical protein [Stylosanthes scabra]